MLATPWTPAGHIRWKVFVEMPARYAGWVEENNLPTPPPAYSPIGMPDGVSYSPAATPLRPFRLQGEHPVTVTVQSPANGARIIENPEMPHEMNTLALHATTTPDVPQVLWYVDGKPYKLADAPFNTRWILEKGEHTFQARLPYRNETSALVHVSVE